MAKPTNRNQTTKPAEQNTESAEETKTTAPDPVEETKSDEIEESPAPAVETKTATATTNDSDDVAKIRHALERYVERTDFSKALSSDVISEEVKFLSNVIVTTLVSAEPEEAKATYRAMLDIVDEMGTAAEKAGKPNPFDMRLFGRGFDTLKVMPTKRIQTETLFLLISRTAAPKTRRERALAFDADNLRRTLALDALMDVVTKAYNL